VSPSRRLATDVASAAAELEAVVRGGCAPQLAARAVATAVSGARRDAALAGLMAAAWAELHGLTVAASGEVWRLRRERAAHALPTDELAGAVAVTVHTGLPGPTWLATKAAAAAPPSCIVVGVDGWRRSGGGRVPALAQPAAFAEARAVLVECVTTARDASCIVLACELRPGGVGTCSPSHRRRSGSRCGRWRCRRVCCGCAAMFMLVDSGRGCSASRRRPTPCWWRSPVRAVGLAVVRRPRHRPPPAALCLLDTAHGVGAAHGHPAVCVPARRQLRAHDGPHYRLGIREGAEVENDELPTSPRAGAATPSRLPLRSLAEAPAGAGMARDAARVAAGTDSHWPPYGAREVAIPRRGCLASGVAHARWRRH